MSAGVSDAAGVFDHLDPAVASRVHDVLGEFRRSCPVARSDAHGGFYVVTRYDAIKHVAQHETEIRRLARAVATELAPRGSADLVLDFAQRIPPIVIASVLGVPEGQRPELSDLVRGLMAARSAQEAADVARRYADFLLAQIRARRGRTGDDLLTSVVNTDIDGRGASDHELLKFTFLMVAAGHLTTTDTIANTALVLAQDDQLRARVAADPSLIAELIEESVRHESAVAATGRTVRVDTTLEDVRLSPGDRLLLTWGSGNRDERYFPDGGEFRLGRERAQPQLGWGAGAHRCLGMHLARLELRVIFEELLAAIPDFRLAAGADPQRTYGVIRGVRTLPIVWAAPAHS
jgi:cytochrome P450